MRRVAACGESLSVVGLGTWQFGSAEWGYGSEYAGGEALAITNEALDLGVNLVDTAELYGFGRSERIVGRVLAERREEAFLATKIAPVAPVPRYIRWRAEASAARLGVDQIDLYQLHQPNPAVPLAAQMAGMGELQRSGLVRHVGVSNYSLERWKAAEEALGAPVLANQIRFNLVDRRALLDSIPWAQANDRVVIAYSPLAQGLLSARYGPDHRPSGMRGALAPFLPENLELARPLFEVLRSVAKAHDAMPAQVALAWVIRHPNVVVIPGASSVAQMRLNAEAADLELSDDEAGELIDTAAAFRPVGGLAALPSIVRQRVGALSRRRAARS